MWAARSGSWHTVLIFFVGIDPYNVRMGSLGFILLRTEVKKKAEFREIN